jgi:hypothetical protein
MRSESVHSLFVHLICFLPQVLDAVILHAEPSYTRTLQQDAVAEADAWQADNVQVSSCNARERLPLRSANRPTGAVG